MKLDNKNNYVKLFYYILNLSNKIIDFIKLKIMEGRSDWVVDFNSKEKEKEK